MPKLVEHLKETKDEEVTKEAIMAMYSHCNIVELDEETSVLVEGKTKVNNVGKPILPCIFKETSHYGLCDLGTEVNVISYDFYLEIKEEIEPATIGNTDITIMLANKNLRILAGVVDNATVKIGNKDFPIDFVVVDMPADTLCPIIFGRNFLGYIGAYVNFKKEIVSLKLGGTENKFHFSKFKDKPPHTQEEEKTIKEMADFLGNQEEEIDEDPNYEEIIMEDKPLGELENEFDSLPILGPPTEEAFEEPEKRGGKELPPPELQTLLKNLKYRFLDDTNKFPIIISAKLSGEGEEEELMKILKEHRRAFRYSMDSTLR